MIARMQQAGIKCVPTVGADAMAAVKLNVFHWHLSDDQGFRVESKKFPKLHEMGSDGLFYTQEEIRGLIAYARERGIRVVPEFDMPGHSTAWFVGHPELASGPGPYQIDRKWGVLNPAMDPTNEKVYKFLDEFIGEMAILFPDHFFHVGGDEVNGKEWDANPKIQEFIRAHDLKNNAGLQLYFNKKLQAIAAAGFDAVEIFESDFISFDGSASDVAKLCRDLGLSICALQPFRDFEGMPEPQRAQNCALACHWPDQAGRAQNCS